VAFYFAYGSNMSNDYFRNVRKMTPISSNPAVLNDYRLVMNLKGPNFVEPSFANICYDKGARVEGVLHEIAQRDFDRIVASEGETYELIETSVACGDRTAMAQTLMSEADTAQDLPTSRRYLKILIKAAIQSDLTDEYIDSLKSKRSVYYPILSEIFAVRVYLWVRSRVH